MQQIVATVTQSGEVVLPEEVRRALGVGPLESVAFTILDGEVRLTKPGRTVESVRGALTLPRHAADIDDVIREAKEERAQQAVEKLRE